MAGVQPRAGPSMKGYERDARSAAFSKASASAVSPRDLAPAAASRAALIVKTATGSPVRQRTATRHSPSMGAG